MLFADLLQVLDPEPHGAALNMALDEALLRTACAPLLRIYLWERPAASFGYFGAWQEAARAWPGRELVRRWTGGGIVPHGEDVTYTLIIPRGHPFYACSPRESYRSIHAAIASAIGAGSLAPSAAPKISEACFENAAQHDVLLAGRKIAGAAQRRTRLGLLHQGSIQPVEDRARISAGLGSVLASQISTIALSPEIRTLAAEIAAERYQQDAWKQRR